MKAIAYVGLSLLLLLFGSCSQQEKSSDKIYDFENLIDHQVSQLSQQARVLGKTSQVSGTKSDTTFLPSGAGWRSELEVFRELEIINKPIYRNEYSIQDPVKDTQSNLKVRQYLSANAPITNLRFYYHNDFSGLKKIEATITEKSLLFFNSRNLTMEFEEEEGKPVLKNYSLEGFQKLILRDTVHFSLQGQIDQ